MIWRAALLLVSAVCLLTGADVHYHREFRSGVVGNVAHPEYSIRCEQIDFQSHQTVVTIRLRDDSPSPQFAAFRETLSQPLAVKSLYVPPAFNHQGGELYARTWDVPDLVLYTKPENSIHEAMATVYFEPLWKLRNDELNIDEVVLKFPGFSEFSVRRVHPVSQYQDISTTLSNALVNSMDIETASGLELIGLIGLIAFLAEIAWNWEMFLYRWKVAKREHRKKYSKENSNGDEMPKSDTHRDDPRYEILVPPEWDEQLISTEFLSLRNRPGALSAFVDGLINRHIIRQADKTSKVRIAFLSKTIEELRLAKELQVELDGLKLREKELQIRELQVEIRKTDLEHQHQVQEELLRAEHELKLLRMQVEAAKLKKEARDYNLRPEKQTPVHKETLEEEAAKLKERIARARQEKAEAQRIADPEERQRCENQWDDRIADLEEELSQLV